ncbi:hypothetical protein GGS23DRAFT_479568 [Durotheca rogersii]|uniref:uncharacterized protein n=1 Tax=Durotheca rogersii TaxID=419775 RepID=UPI00221F245E|nr:uncharacterized protein GGS23DRAFT_479568 [Durotheca rogersii]KAI5864033.1 hypothetical protein GGS23DRAFT_479568 [Durotheca rogersii]
MAVKVVAWSVGSAYITISPLFCSFAWLARDMHIIRNPVTENHPASETDLQDTKANLGQVGTLETSLARQLNAGELRSENTWGGGAELDRR